MEIHRRQRSGQILHACRALAAILCTSAASFASDEEAFQVTSVVCPSSNDGVLEIHSTDADGGREIIRAWYQHNKVVKTEIGVAEETGDYEYWASVNTKTEMFIGVGRTVPLGEFGRKVLADVTRRGAEAIAEHCSR